MLIRTSGVIHSGFLLLKLGHTCRYLVAGSDNTALIDSGLSAHAPLLIQRLKQFGIDPKELTAICLTHLHAERIMAIPALREINPSLHVCGTAPMAKKLLDLSFLESLIEEDRVQCSALGLDHRKISPAELKRMLSVDKILTESDILRADDEVALHLHSSPGHTPESVSYYVEPYGYLIVDEGFGYYRGRDPVAPGGDDSLSLALASAKKWKDSDLAGLAFPNFGLITGELVQRHLAGLEENTSAIASELVAAKESGMTAEEIKESIQQGLFSTESTDPVVHHSLMRSCSAVWNQLAAIADTHAASAPLRGVIESK